MNLEEYIMIIMKLNINEYLKTIKNIKEKSMTFMKIYNLKENLMIKKKDGMEKLRNIMKLIN